MLIPPSRVPMAEIGLSDTRPAARFHWPEALGSLPLDCTGWTLAQAKLELLAQCHSREQSLAVMAGEVECAA
jgi:hypothetical protein